MLAIDAAIPGEFTPEHCIQLQIVWLEKFPEPFPGLFRHPRSILAHVPVLRRRPTPGRFRQSQKARHAIQRFGPDRFQLLAFQDQDVLAGKELVKPLQLLPVKAPPLSLLPLNFIASR